eukprot:3086250-Rhodomonas_salina.2
MHVQHPRGMVSDDPSGTRPELASGATLTHQPRGCILNNSVLDHQHDASFRADRRASGEHRSLDPSRATVASTPVWVLRPVDGGMGAAMGPADVDAGG